MLVLNTNQGGGGENVLSNDFLGIYPDFKNAILLFVPGEQKSFGTIAENKAVKTVNGTKINAFFDDVISTDYYLGVNGSNAGKCMLVNDTTKYQTPVAYRIGLDKEFDGGEIIGKKCYCGILGGGSIQSVGVTGQIDSIKVKIQLLHLDGTLTQICEFNYGSISSYATDNSNTGTHFSEYADILKFFEGDGVIAVSGDILVVDFSRITSSSSNTNYKQRGPSFGYKYSNNGSLRYKPIQVSID